MLKISKFFSAIFLFFARVCYDVAVNVISALASTTRTKEPSSSTIHQSDEDGLIHITDNYLSETATTRIQVGQGGSVKIKNGSSINQRN
jgi:hypothetical protein